MTMYFSSSVLWHAFHVLSSRDNEERASSSDMYLAFMETTIVLSDIISQNMMKYLNIVEYNISDVK